MGARQDVMRHTGGVPYFLKHETSTPGCSVKGKKEEDYYILSPEELRDPKCVDRAVENSVRQPEGELTRQYHSLTRGCLVDGICRRVDPKGRSITQFIAEEICAPLGVTEYLPVITEADMAKINIAPIGPPSSMFPYNMEFGPSLLGMGDPIFGEILSMFAPDSAFVQSQGGTNALHNPETGQMDGARAALPEVLATPLTSAFTHASARAQTAIYDAAYISSVGKLISKETLAEVFANEVSAADGGLLGKVTTLTQGGLAVYDEGLFGSNAESVKGFYGWGGWGGSMTCVDPKRSVTVNYCMSGMGSYLVGDPRSFSIFEAYQAVMKAKGK